MAGSSHIDLTMQLRLAQVLKKIRLFESLADQVLYQVAKTMDTRYFQENFVIFEKGDKADALYVVKSGKVLIYQPDKYKGVAEEIAVLGENDYFGEMGLVSQKPRNASARTLEDSLLFVLTKDEFLRLLNETPQIATDIMQTYMQREKDNKKRTFRMQMMAKHEDWAAILSEIVDGEDNPQK